jgi:hypothetical protein
MTNLSPNHVDTQHNLANQRSNVMLNFLIPERRQTDKTLTRFGHNIMQMIVSTPVVKNASDLRLIRDLKWSFFLNTHLVETLDSP